MRILYITELWNGFEDIICKGKSEASGMPAFLFPLKEMLTNKGYNVDFALVVKESKNLNIGVEWLKNSNYYWVFNKSFLKIYTILNIIRKQDYDFIYGHGGGGGWGNFAALLSRKPFGMRYYGTFLAQHLDDSYFRFFRRNLLKSLVYNLPKKFMLITNDGTKGDLVYNKLCLSKKLYDFKFWLNGVYKALETSDDVINLPVKIQQIFEQNYRLLLYPARFDPWKRQDLAIEILRELKSRSNETFFLMFCGHNYDSKYFDKLVNLTSLYKLKDYVVFSDPLEPLLLSRLMKKAFVVLSLYNYSNLGNVMIESALRGSFVATIKDGSTDFIIENDITGISLPYDGNFISNIVDKLIYYSDRAEEVDRIRQNIHRKADEVFLTWDERNKIEIELIEENIALPK